MSVKEVTLLRKSGKLREAYKLAYEELQEDENDPWVQMSMFWVLRDMCQEHCKNNARDKAKICLEKMSSLLPTMMDDDEIGKRAYTLLVKRLQPEADIIMGALELSKSNSLEAYMQVKIYISSSKTIDVSFHEDLGWIIYRYLKANVETLSSLDVRKLLRDYIYLQNEKPSLLHSQILNFALGYSKEHLDFSFYRFFLLWNPENLRYDDLHGTYYDGKTYPSLISRICRQIVNSGEDIDVQVLKEKINLSQTEILDLLREPQFWHLMDLHKEGKMDEMFEAFSIYNKKNVSLGPSSWHSKVLGLAERYMDEQDMWRFIHFFKEWGYENLMYSDWIEETDSNGRIYKSLAEKSAKKCFEILKATPEKREELLLWLNTFYDEVLKHISDEWTLRQRAIIYVWLKQYEASIDIYKSLLLEMSDKYYIWSELADCIQNNNDLKIGLLSKALLLEKDENFIGPIRLSLASVLIDSGFIAEGLCELNFYKKSHDKASSKYEELIKMIDNPLQGIESNKQLYLKFSTIAEEYVYSDLDGNEVVLTDKWERDGKKYCSFSNGNELVFQVKEKRFPILTKSKLGTVFYVKCHKQLKQNMQGMHSYIVYQYVPLCIRKCDSEPWSCFPFKYGFIEYKNEDKKILHIISQDSTLIFQECKNNWHSISKGDFITYREYLVDSKGEKKFHAQSITKIEKDIALQHFKTSVVAVDDINIGKSLFHYTFGQGRIGGVVHFDETEIRPELAQCLKITYCVSKDKKGEKKAIVLQIEETDEINSRAIKTIRGRLELKYRNFQNDEKPDFAFIGDYYVHQSILEKYDITCDCEVTAVIVYAGKDRWKVVKIIT